MDIEASEKNQTGQSIMDLDSLVADRKTPNSFWVVNYNGVLTDQLFAEAQYSNKKFAFLNSGSPYYDLIKGRSFWTARAAPATGHRRSGPPRTASTATTRTSP